MEGKGIKIIQEPIFDCASIPLDVVARALSLDKQTIRIMLQQGLVDWGLAFKLPKSSMYTYIVYPRAFWLATGFIYRRDEHEESQNECL